MVGAHEIVFLHHPGYLHQEVANHQGIDVKHLRRFNCFHTSIPLDTQCMSFYIPRTCLRRLQWLSQPLKSQLRMVVELVEQRLSLG